MKRYKIICEDKPADSRYGGPGTAQFYDGDSDVGVQAGKPGKVDDVGSYNLKQIANAVTAAVKSNTDARAKLDAKNLKATGKLSVKAGKNLKFAGQAELDFKTNQADITVPVKIKNKQVNLEIENLDVSKPQNIFNKKIKGRFIDPADGKESFVMLKFNPNKDTYFFKVGEERDQYNFDITVDVDDDSFKIGSGLSFDVNSFVPNNLSPKVEVGVEYDSLGGLAGSIVAEKDFALRAGKLNVGFEGGLGAEEKYGMINVEYVPKNLKKDLPIEKQAMRTVKDYAKFDTYTKIGKMKTDDTGASRLDKDLEKIKKLFKEQKIYLKRSQVKNLIRELLNIK